MRTITTLLILDQMRISWCLVVVQYIALCGSLTTQPPDLYFGFDPFYGSWWNQPGWESFYQPADLPKLEPTKTPPAGVPAVKSIIPLDNKTVSSSIPPILTTTKPTSRPTTKPTSRPTTKPTSRPTTKPPTYDTDTIKTTRYDVHGSTEYSISLQELIRLAFGNVEHAIMGTPKHTDASVSDLNSISQKRGIITAPATHVNTNIPATTAVKTTESPVVPTVETAAAPTTTVQTTTKPTTSKPTTTARSKPWVKMTLGEILMLKSKIQTEKNGATVKTTSPKPRGCHYNGHFYEPLKEIEKGQTGNWCYGTYCNREGTVVHWDDHKCSTTQSKPPAPVSAAAPKSASLPVVINPMTGMAGLGGSAGIAEMTGLVGSGTTGGFSGMGCLHKGRWYAPGADIQNLRDFGRCYGSYCDYNSKLVQWNDRCTATISPQTMGMGGHMSMGDQMGILAQMGMGEHMGMGEQMGTGGQMGAGGQMGMGDQMGMGGQMGAGGNSQSMAMRQLQQLDLL